MGLYRLLLAATLAFAPLYSSAGQASSPQIDSSAAPAIELNPILIDTDDSNGAKGEVLLSIDLDGKGAVAHAKAISGPKELTGPAIADAKNFVTPIGLTLQTSRSTSSFGTAPMRSTWSPLTIHPPP